ncbi:zinc ribbon domain-containing protein [Proteocatella sphenisci]|uniref:zinc ribbon domain-containing protein n=1 Tax=Proteocatella sphenisci TaxID=181070 RepID=UPI00048A50BB|nr:zinc ribbon domain-containing protein [Proteocatella sphenisci]
MSKKEISQERKMLYYGGMAVTGIGVLLFFSAFLSFMNPMGMLMEDSMSSFMMRPFIGIIMIAAGGFMRTVAARGVAGSGMVLDPKKAREDLSPWSSMAGGLIKDALDETDLDSKKEIIKIRCINCSELNDEDATFCKKCGKKI